MRLPRNAGYHFDRKTMVIRPDGKRACRWCKGPVAPPKRTFCSATCIAAWRWRRDEGYVRGVVFERDRGMCAACGRNTVTVDYQAAELAYRAAVTAAGKARGPVPTPDSLVTAAAWCVATGTTPERSPWEADHRVPLASGGPHELVNMQTLCVPCHRAKTTRENRDRARARRV